jgi:hypothetical protein
VQPYKEWAEEKGKTGLLDKLNPLNPLSYVFEQAAPLGFRAVLIMLGVALILLAFIKMAFGVKEKAEEFVEIA